MTKKHPSTLTITSYADYSEAKLHQAVCEYLKLQYPDVIFLSEASGIRTTIGMAVKLKMLRSEKDLPDLWIMEPKGGFHAQVLELKREGTKLFKRDMKTYASEHIEGQADILSRLRCKGYDASFAIGFDMAKLYIDTYMALK